jgi:hypothetical protein
MLSSARAANLAALTRARPSRRRDKIFLKKRLTFPEKAVIINIVAAGRRPERKERKSS